MKSVPNKRRGRQSSPPDDTDFVCIYQPDTERMLHALRLVLAAPLPPPPTVDREAA